MNILFVLLLVLSVNHLAFGEKIVVCYYGTWATYRNGLGKFDVDDFRADLCTHAIYTFVGIDSQGTVISLDSYLDLAENYGRDNFRKFTALKQKNPKLKTILAVGGWNEASAKYSIMAADPALRQNFIQSALKMILDHNFDGLDVDWEYPNQRDTVHGEADIQNYVQLLKEVKEAFDPHGLLVTAAVASTKQSASLSYDIPAISKYLDIINLMTYDMYGSWDTVTGHNSPLHKGEGDEAAAKEDVFTVDVALDYWLTQGCPPEKLVVGLPLYGRTFTLTDPNVNTVRAPVSGVGVAGPYTGTNGFLGYNEFCYKLLTETWDVRYDSLAKVPYAVKDRNWVSFDDADSLVKKVEYSSQYNLAGAMVWSIETDDFHGICGGSSFPLLKAINKALGRIIDDDTTTESVNTTTTSTTAVTSTTASSTTASSTTASSTTTVSGEITNATTITTTQASSATVCTEEGFAVNPVDCSSFYWCVRSVDGSLVAVKMECPKDLVWDHKISTCNYDYLVECDI